MKRLVATLAFSLGAYAVFAAAYGTVGKYTFKDCGDGTAVITKCTNTISGAISIPSKLDGLKVVEINGRWDDPAVFGGCTKLTAVTIPGSVTNLAKETFMDCVNLRTVKFADLRSRVRIGGKAFRETAVTSIVLPRDVELDDNAFYDSEIEVVTFIGEKPPAGLDLALNQYRVRDGKLKVEVGRLVIPYGANLSEWKAAVPKFLKRHGVIAKSQPRVWIDSASGGSLVVTAGSKKIANGGFVKKGVKVTCTCKPATGYALAGASYTTRDVAHPYGALKKTIAMPGCDMTFSAEFVTREAEKEGFDKALAEMADGVLSGSSNGQVESGGRQHLCALGDAGLLFEAEMKGVANFVSPVAFSFVGLPGGLSLVAHEGGRALVGVPTATVDFARSPAYVKMSTPSGLTATLRLNLSIAAAEAVRWPARGEDGSLAGEAIFTGAATAIARAEVPASYDAFAPQNPPKGFAWDPAAAEPIVFTPSVPGRVTVPMTNVVESAVTGKAYVQRKNLVFDVYGRATPGVNAAFDAVEPEYAKGVVGRRMATWNVAAWFADGKSAAKAAGVPAGISFDAKKLRFTGTPKKAGTFVVTMSKKIKGKTVTRKFNWIVAKGNVEFDVAPTAEIARQSVDWADGRVGLLAGYTGALGASCPAGGKITASGLPSGMKLVRATDGTYRVSGAPKAAGKYVVTIACSNGGATARRRFEIDVFAHPLRGSFRGVASTPGVGGGTATMSVTSQGRATLTIVEGGLKTVVGPVACVVEQWGGAADPERGVFRCAFKLPKDKKRGLPARTATLVYGTESAVGYRRMWIVSGEVASGGKGASDALRCWPYMTAAQLADAAYNVNGAAVEEEWSGTVETLRKGKPFTFSARGTPSLRTVKVTGRLPAGKTFTASAPVVATDASQEGAPVAPAEIAYAPIVLVDADGARYKITLPLRVEALFTDAAQVQVWDSQVGAFVDDLSAPAGE